MRWSVALLVALLGLGFAAWRSGDRPPLDEMAIAESRTGLALESRRVATGEVELHVVLAGPEHGAPVLLLHGFPELWFSWHGVMPSLVENGYRVIAPDLRGYNRSDKPPGPEAYSGDAFARDVLGLLDALGIERAFVAGHDVGAGVAWTLVFLHPERVRRAVILSSPHPLAWERATPQDDASSISWFRTFFKLPFSGAGCQQAVAAHGNLQRTSRPAFRRLAVFQSAGRAMRSEKTNAYRTASPRAALRRPSAGPRIAHGGRDATCRRRPLITAELLRLAVVELPEASHWLLLEEPERRQLMVTFSQGGTPHDRRSPVHAAAAALVVPSASATRRTETRSARAGRLHGPRGDHADGGSGGPTAIGAVDPPAERGNRAIGFASRVGERVACAAP
jgi:pimeloyl-ACP methyl ester carboxylesterase